MKIKRIVTRVEDIEVPDCFGIDKTLRGELADLLLELEGVCRIRTRGDLFSEEAGLQDAAIRNLRKAYGDADAIKRFVQKTWVASASTSRVRRE